LNHNLKETLEQLENLPTLLNNIVDELGADLNPEERAKVNRIKVEAQGKTPEQLHEMLLKAQKDLNDAK
jgi:hypothetical protein